MNEQSRAGLKPMVPGRSVKPRGCKNQPNRVQHNKDYK